MGLHQFLVAPPVPDDHLLRFALANFYFDKQYESFFNRDKYSHLAICLRLMEPTYIYWV